MKFLVSVLKYLLMLSIGGGLLYWVLKDLDWEGLKSEITHINKGYIAIVFVIAVLSHWFRSARWVLLMRPLGYTVSVLNSFWAVMIGYLANLAVPRMGEISRCLIIHRSNRVPVDKLIGTVVVERIVDLLCLLIIVALTFVLEFDKLSDVFTTALQAKGDKPASGSLFTTTNIIIAGVGLLALAAAGIYLIYRLRHLPIIQKGLKILQGFSDGMKTIRQMDKGWLFVVHTVGMWVMYYLQIYICFKAMPGTSHLGLLAALSVLTMGTFGFVAPTNGGVGAYHAIVKLTLVTAYSIAGSTAAAFALIAHTFQTLVVILLGIIAYVYITVNFKKMKADEPVEANTAEAVS